MTITIRNLKPFDKGIDAISHRAAHLVQGMEHCPIEEIIHALTVFDSANSPDAKSPNARRWIKQFAGFDSSASGKAIEPLVEIIAGDSIVESSKHFDQLLREAGIGP